MGFWMGFWLKVYGKNSRLNSRFILQHKTYKNDPTNYFFIIMHLTCPKKALFSDIGNILTKVWKNCRILAGGDVLRDHSVACLKPRVIFYLISAKLYLGFKTVHNCWFVKIILIDETYNAVFTPSVNWTICVIWVNYTQSSQSKDANKCKRCELGKAIFASLHVLCKMKKCQLEPQNHAKRSLTSTVWHVLTREDTPCRTMFFTSLVQI